MLTKRRQNLPIICLPPLLFFVLPLLLFLSAVLLVLSPLFVAAAVLLFLPPFVVLFLSSEPIVRFGPVGIPVRVFGNGVQQLHSLKSRVPYPTLRACCRRSLMVIWRLGSSCRLTRSRKAVTSAAVRGAAVA